MKNWLSCLVELGLPVCAAVRLRAGKWIIWEMWGLHGVVMKSSVVVNTLVHMCVALVLGRGLTDSRI